MKRAPRSDGKTNAVLVLSTAPNAVTARRIARAVLLERLAACVHIAARGESSYWWKGRIEQTGEFAMTFKTSAERKDALIAAIAAAHPYKVPEILVLPGVEGSAAYLQWVEKETRPRR